MTTNFNQQLAQCFNDNADKFCSTIARILNETSAAPEVEDVLSRVMVKVLQRSEQFRGDSALSTWLHVACAREARDVLRSANHSKRAMTPAEDCRETVGARSASSQGQAKPSPTVWTQADIVPQRLPTPLQALLAKEALRRAHGAMADLPEAQREAHRLVRIERLTQTQAAGALGVSQPTIVRLLKRADAALQAAR